jgi:glycosyltransferase involved in cell wall biosynthesis
MTVLRPNLEMPASGTKGFSLLGSVYAGTKAKEFEQCLKSIENQILAPNQVVVVLDGPVDADVQKVLHSFSSRLPLHTVALSDNQGLGKALSAGLKQCTHNFVARFDTDDVCLENRFENQVSFLLLNPDVSVVGSLMRETYHLGKKSIICDRSGAAGSVNLRTWARRRNPLNHPTVVFRKEAINAVGGYVDCPLFEDYFLWARLILANHKIVNLNFVGVETVVDNDFFSRRGGLKYLKCEIQFLRKLYAIGFLNLFDLIVWGIIRMPARLLPVQCRKWLYLKFLRS